MENLKLTPDQMALAHAIAALSQTTLKDTLPSAVAQQLHGTGGAAAAGSFNQRVYNTQAVPVPGLLRRLRMRPTTTESPLQEIRLNQAANAGSHPAAGSCGPCKTPGDTALGSYSFVFGQLCFSTPKVDTSDILRMGVIKNRGDFRDYQLIGTPFANNGSVPSVPGATKDPISSELDNIMLSFQIGHQKEFGKLLWTGNPANNSGRYKEFKGLKLLINTGYTDAIGGGALTAADALVQSFSGTLGTNADLDNSIVQKLVNFLRKLKNRADVRGYVVDWAVVMSEQLFYELTALWPCTYLTNRCAPTSGTANNGVTVNIESTDQVRMRDEMRSGSYLWIDGVKVAVDTDNSVNETALTDGDAGKFAAEIFALPLRVNGIDATYMEYFDYSNPFAMKLIQAFANGESVIVRDGGRTLWARRSDGFCVSMDYTEAPRVILETPFLSGRLTDIKYTPTVALETGH